MSKKKAKFACGTISQIRSAFKELLKPCGRKQELTYNFTFDENVKRNLVNESYYIRIGDTVEIGREPQALEIRTRVEVCLFYQCGKLEVDTQERALIEGEGVLVHIMNPENRPACFVDIDFDRMFIRELGPDNDLILKVCLEFEVRQCIIIDAVI